MHDTSKADADLDFSDSDLDMSSSLIDIDKEMRKTNHMLFLVGAFLVLIATAVAWKQVKPDMSTYDGIVVLLTFLIVGFWLVLIMCVSVWFRQRDILDLTRDMQKTIREINKLPLLNLRTPNDDLYFQLIEAYVKQSVPPPPDVSEDNENI